MKIINEIKDYCKFMKDGFMNNGIEGKIITIAVVAFIISLEILFIIILKN